MNHHAAVQTFPRVRSNPATSTAGFGGPAPSVVVLGAGAAGLSAALALKDAGYDRVTVIDNADRVGGKCNTVVHQGRTFELGAAALTVRYRHVRELLSRFGLPTKVTPSGFHVEPGTGGKKSYLVPAPRQRNWLSLGKGWVRFAAELVRHRDLFEPGFRGVSRELATPYAEWSAARGLGEVDALFGPWFTGFGYGYAEEIPAAYMLKYVTVCNFPLSEVDQGGFQTLWERVAARLDVRLGVNVKKIDRTDDGVFVDTGKERLHFDRLVVACPLDTALTLLEPSSEERRLFSKIEYVDYRVVAATTEGLSTDRYTFMNGTTRPKNRGEVMFVYRRHREMDAHTFYTIGDAPSGTTIDAAHACARDLGGRVKEVFETRKWRYFPHVKSEDLRAGFFDDVERMQGQRHTTYVGEALCFPTVETVVAYSRRTIAEQFPAIDSARAARIGG
jgi:hypothetical protein